MPNEIWNIREVENLISGQPITHQDVLTVDQLLAIENARLLKSINSKLTFIVVIIILGIILSILSSCMASL